MNIPLFQSQFESEFLYIHWRSIHSNNHQLNTNPINIWPDTFGRSPNNETYPIFCLYNPSPISISYNSLKLSILRFLELISEIMEVVLDLMQRHMWEELFDHVDKEFENGMHSKRFYIIQMTDPFSLFNRMVMDSFLGPSLRSLVS